MNTTHTPGPWISAPEKITGTYGVVCTKSEGTVVAGTANDEYSRATCLANARLIAAAPDLLAACKAGLELIANTNAGDGTILAEMREAIRQAEGKGE